MKIVKSDKQDVLIAVSGLSPAVLTETIWALAHENTPVVPEHIVVITTRMGSDRLKQVLFRENNWTRFLNALKSEHVPVSGKLRFGPAQDSIRLLPSHDAGRDLNDIIHPSDSEAAADYILRTVREFSEDPDTRIIASVAGGRKTMSALLTSCMVLLGRKQDRLCHVLVNTPYDSPQLKPLFLFPENGVKHHLPNTRKSFLSTNARIELTEIPFVRTRGWYEHEYKKAPSSYMTLVKRMQGIAPEPVNYPNIVLQLQTGTLTVGESKLTLSAMEFGFFVVLIKRITGKKPVRAWPDIEEDLKVFVRDGSLEEVLWHSEFREKMVHFDAGEDTRKIVSRLRKKMKAVFDPVFVDYLLPNLKLKRALPNYPVTKIRIRK